MSTKTTIAGNVTFDASTHPTLMNGQVYNISADPTGVTSINYSIDATRNIIGSPYKAPFTARWTCSLKAGPHTLYVERRGPINGKTGQLSFDQYPFNVVDQVAAPTTQPQQPTPPASTTPTPTPTPSATGGGNVPAAIHKYDWGFDASDKDNVEVLGICLTHARADGAKVLRIWHTGFGAISAENIAIIKLAKSLGYTVILCQNVKDGEARNLGNPDTAGFVAKNRAILASIDYIEAGNELNLNQYRPDDLGSNWQVAYVTRWLSPLYNALKGVGPKLLVCSITDVGTTGTWSANYKALVAAGALNVSDGVAIHCYMPAGRIAAMTDDLKTTKALVGNHPILMTEGGVVGWDCKTLDDYKRIMPNVLLALNGIVTAATIYRGLPNSIQSVHTLFDPSGNPTAEYAVVVQAMK